MSGCCFVCSVVVLARFQMISLGNKRKLHLGFSVSLVFDRHSRKCLLNKFAGWDLIPPAQVPMGFALVMKP